MTKTATPTQKPTRALNEISKDYIELNFLLDSIEDEISPEQQTQLNEFLQGLETDRNKKVDAYCAVIRELEARGAVRKAEADRISKLSGYVANRAKRLKWLLLNFLQTQGMEKIETDFNVIRRSVNASAPVVIAEYFEEHPEELEEKFRTVTFKPNLKAIAQALKDGEKLDFASFGEKGENLKIG